MLVAEIGTYLHNKAIGIFDTTGATGNIFIMTMGSAPDDAIGIYPRGGSMSDGKLGYDYVAVELLIRGVDPITTSDKAQKIYNLLQGFHSGYFIPLGIYVVSCLCDQGSPNFIGKDENKRIEFSINLTLEIKNFEGGRNNGNS